MDLEVADPVSDSPPPTFSCNPRFSPSDAVLLKTQPKIKRKPSPKPFKLALEKMNLNPEEVLMIGDWPDRDVVGASQIGMKTIFARYGDTFGTKDSGADWDVNDIYEVVGIIKELNNV